MLTPRDKLSKILPSSFPLLAISWAGQEQNMSVHCYIVYRFIFVPRASSIGLVVKILAGGWWGLWIHPLKCPSCFHRNLASLRSLHAASHGKLLPKWPRLQNLQQGLTIECDLHLGQLLRWDFLWCVKCDNFKFMTPVPHAADAGVKNSTFIDLYREVQVGYGAKVRQLFLPHIEFENCRLSFEMYWDEWGLPTQKAPHWKKHILPNTWFVSFEHSFIGTEINRDIVEVQPAAMLQRHRGFWFLYWFP